MDTFIMALSVDSRVQNATDVQNALTKHGCIISTRLGLHEVSDDSCAQNGLIILHIVCGTPEITELENDLKIIKGVKVNCMKL